MKKENLLTKEELKKIVGGTEPAARGCGIACAPGLFSCCNGSGATSVCVCYDSIDTSFRICSSGGEGSSSCTAPDSE